MTEASSTPKSSRKIKALVSSFIISVLIAFGILACAFPAATAKVIVAIIIIGYIASAAAGKPVKVTRTTTIRIKE